MCLLGGILSSQMPLTVFNLNYIFSIAFQIGLTTLPSIEVVTIHYVDLCECYKDFTAALEYS